MLKRTIAVMLAALTGNAAAQTVGSAVRMNPRTGAGGESISGTGRSFWGARAFVDR